MRTAVRESRTGFGTSRRLSAPGPFGGVGVVAAIGTPTVLALPWVQQWLAPRVFIEAFLAALGLPALVLLLRRAEPSRGRLAAAIAVAFGMWVLVASFASGHPALSMLGRFATSNGALLSLSLLASWAIGFSAGVEASTLLEKALFVAVMANAGVAVVQGLTSRGLIAGRAPGFFDNPVYLSGLLVAGLWLLAHRLRRHPAAGGTCIFAVAIAIQMSGSRVAIVLLPLVLIAVVVGLGKRAGASFVAFLFPGVVVGALLLAPVSGPSGTSRLSAGTSGTGYRSRLEAWAFASHAIADRPIVGAGPGLFHAATGRYETLRFARDEGADRTFVDAHNLFVEYAVTTGVAGALLLLAFLTLAISVTEWRSPLAGFAFIGLLVQLVEPQHPNLTPLFFLALGAAASRHKLQLGVARWAGIPGLALAAAAGTCVALGAFMLGQRPHTEAAAYADARWARTLLPIWYEPYDLTAAYDEYSGSVDPAAEQRAVAWRIDAVRREPDVAVVADALARLDARIGDHEGADRAFHVAIAANPWSERVLMDYSRELRAWGHTAAADVYLKKVRLLDPGASSP